MKKYVSPEIEVVKVESADVICASLGGDTDMGVGDLLDDLWGE